MKKILLFTVMLLLLGGLSFAGGQAEGKGDEAVTVSMIGWQGDRAPAWDAIIEDFEKKNPNIMINSEYLGDAYDSTVRTRAMGNALDIFAVQPGGQTITWARSGYAVELGNEPFVKNCIPGAVDVGTVDGVIYGVAVALNTMCVYYNKDLYKEYNLSVPKTWEDFLKVCDTFKSNGITPLSSGFTQKYIAGNHFKMMAAHMDPDNAPGLWLRLLEQKMTLMDEPYPTVFAAMKELYDRGYYNEGVEATDKHAAASLFAQGKVAMDVEGTWRTGAIADAEGSPDFAIFCMPGPGSTNPPVNVIQPAQPYFIHPKSKHIEEAKKFYNHMMSKEMNTILCNMTGQVPAVRGVKLDYAPLQMVADYISSTRSVLGPNLKNPSLELETLLFEAMTRVALGEDVEKVSRDVQKRIDALPR